MTLLAANGAASAIAQEITAEERQQAKLYLAQTRDYLLGAIKGLSSTQWHFIPGPDSWSIGQNVEHAIFVLDRVAGPVWDMLVQAPPPSSHLDKSEVDAIVIHQFPTRLKKFPAPEFAMPGSRFATVSEAIQPLTDSYAKLAAKLECPDLRLHALEALPLKAVTNGRHDTMDGYQWILAAAAHAERHTNQMLEVKAHKNFPVN